MQRIAPDEVLGRFFGALGGLSMFAPAVGSITAAGLIGAFGVRGRPDRQGVVTGRAMSLPAVDVAPGDQTAGIDRSVAGRM